MIVKAAILAATLLVLTACDNFTPREKTASFDPETGQLSLPHPCPDWSQTHINYRNELHSNYGCAVNNNLAVQVEDPVDLHQGHGNAKPIPEIRERYLERFYKGEIPETLSPIQSTGSGQ